MTSPQAEKNVKKFSTIAERHTPPEMSAWKKSGDSTWIGILLIGLMIPFGFVLLLTALLLAMAQPKSLTGKPGKASATK